MKKKLAWVCLLVSPLVLGGAAFCLADRDPITQANCDKIKPGMTLKEVETILGREKDCYAGDCEQDVVWIGTRGKIIVRRDEDPITLPPLFVPSPPKTIFEKIRSWLGL